MPRRQNARWLDGDCPAEVLAIYDNGGKTWDRYTILYVPAKGMTYIEYLGASAHPSDPQGFGQHGEFRDFAEAAAYRYQERNRAAKWTDLPPDVQRAVRNDCRGLAAFH